MNSKLFLLAVLSVFFICAIASAQVEEITLSTYYPAPYGEYEEMAAEKLFADKVIIGNMDVDGDGIDSTPADITLVNVGSILIENNVGIGTAWPNAGFHLHDPAWNTDVYIGNPPQTVHGHVSADAAGIFVSSDTNYGPPGGYGGHVFFVNKETAKTWHVGVGNDDSFRITETAMSNCMNFLPGGNVGIGTQNPSAKLVINSGAYDFAHEMRIENDDPGEEAGMRFRSRNAANTAWLHADIGLYAEGGYLGFKVPHSNSVGGGYRMVIKDDGNVGIGTTNPQAKLDVNGTLRTSGRFDFPDYLGWGQWREAVVERHNSAGWATAVDYSGSGVLLFAQAYSYWGANNRLRITIDGVVWRDYTGRANDVGANGWNLVDDSNDHNSGIVTLMPFKKFTTGLRVEIYNASGSHETSVRVNYLTP